MERLIENPQLFSRMDDVAKAQLEGYEVTPKWRTLYDIDSDFELGADDLHIGVTWYAIQRAECLLVNQLLAR